MKGFKDDLRGLIGCKNGRAGGVVVVVVQGRAIKGTPLLYAAEPASAAFRPCGKILDPLAYIYTILSHSPTNLSPSDLKNQ